MTDITWDETLPADASDGSVVDDDIRSMLTNMSGGIGESMYWPGPTATQGSSAASSGELKPGSLRFARAGPSARTGGHSNGFLLLDSNRVSIHHIGSENTMFLGHADMHERVGGIGNAPFTTSWLIQEGTFPLGSNVTVTVESISTNYPIPYNGIPEVYLSPTSNGFNWVYGLSATTSAGITANFSYIGGIAGVAAPIFLWRSEGTVAF